MTAKTATESDSEIVDVLKPSGPAWVKEFPGSTSTSTLAPSFRKNVERFLAALHKAHATVRISATYRPAERAHLMYWAYQIAHNGYDPSKVPQQDPPKAGTPPEPIVPICWMHYKADGTEDLATSRTKAREMVAAYDIVYEPAHPSRHEIRRAIDVKIEWTGTLKIKDAKGKLHKIGAPRSGAKNTELWTVGKSYGVIKLKGDPPHWSDDGR